MLSGLLSRWRGRKNAEIEAEYGHATFAERQELEQMHRGGVPDSTQRHMDEDFDIAEGRPGEDDLPRDDDVT